MNTIVCYYISNSKQFLHFLLVSFIEIYERSSPSEERFGQLFGPVIWKPINVVSPTINYVTCYLVRFEFNTRNNVT